MGRKRIQALFLAVFLIVSAGLVSYCVKYDREAQKKREQAAQQAAAEAEEKRELVELSFETESGFYSDPFALRIKAAELDPGAGAYVIKYTLDGSEPTWESESYPEKGVWLEDATVQPNRLSMRTDVSVSFLKEYEAYAGLPFIQYQAPDYLIDKCNVVKARCFSAETQKPISGVTCGSYFVGLGDKEEYQDIDVISLVIKESDFFDEKSGIYVLGNRFQYYLDHHNLTDNSWLHWYGNFSHKGKRYEREVTIEYFDAEQNHVFSKEVGCRIHGNSSRKIHPKSLKLYARNEYDGTDQFDYDFWGTGYHPDVITLSNNGNDYNTRAHNMLVANLSRTATDKHFRPCVMFLNGEYWGFYYLTEKFTEDYFHSRYEETAQSDIVVLRTSQSRRWVTEIGKEKDAILFCNTEDFITGNDMSKPANYQRACQLIDVDNFTDYLSAFCYISRCEDWPIGLNLTVWRTRASDGEGVCDGRWRWLAYDFDSMSMRLYLVGFNPIAYLRENLPIFDSLWQNEEFQALMLQKLDKAKEDFAYERVSTYLDGFYAQYGPQIAAHNLRFFGNADYADLLWGEAYQDKSTSTFHESVEMLYEFFRQRETVMRDFNTYKAALDFRSELVGTDLYTSGIYGDEGEFAWTTKDIETTLVSGGDTLRISASTMCYILPRTAKVYVNGKLLDTITLEFQEKTFAIDLSDVLAPDGKYHIQIHANSDFKPSDWSPGSPDTRALCMQLYYLGIGQKGSLQAGYDFRQGEVLDTAYIDGIYGDEGDFTWTKKNVDLQLLSDGNTLKIDASTMCYITPRSAEIYVNDTLVETAVFDFEEKIVSIDLSGVKNDAGMYHVQIKVSDDFVPSKWDPASPDDRNLCLQLYSIGIE